MLWISTIIFKVLSFLPEKVFEKISDSFEEAKKVEKEFMQIYTSLRLTHLDRDIDRHLKRLRDFFQREYKLLEKPQIVQFYAKWIEERWIPIQFEADDAFWTQARYAELLEDMEKIKPLI
jgi:hypothetical protein